MQRAAAIQEELFSKKCCFCKKAVNNPLLGEKCTANKIVCHYYCLVRKYRLKKTWKFNFH